METVEDVDRLELPDPTRVRYLTQTTLSLDETRDIIVRLKERFPLIQGPPAQDICYATENRQMAVKAVSEAIDLLLVVGSQNSSNSKRLVEVGDNFGVRSFLVNDRSDVDRAWLEGVRNVGVTAGASAPEHLVQELIEFLRDLGFHQMEEIELVDEDVRFSLPVGTDCFDTMSAPLQVRDTLESAAERAKRRAASYLAELAAARRTLVRGTHRRHHARIRLHPVPALAVSAERRPVGCRRPGR